MIDQAPAIVQQWTCRGGKGDRQGDQLGAGKLTIGEFAPDNERFPSEKSGYALVVLILKAARQPLKHFIAALEREAGSFEPSVHRQECARRAHHFLPPSRE